MKAMKWLATLCLIFLSSCSSNDKELHIYSWGDYINPEVVKKFEEKYHCRVILDTYDSNESMYSKLKSGATGYDLIFPSNYILDLLNQQQMLQPIDKTKIPNLKYLDTHLIELLKTTVDASSIPYMLTFSGIGYRQDHISNMVDSWNAFGQSQWRGRMTMLNDFRETIGAGLKYLGYSVNSKEEKEIQAAADQVIKSPGHAPVLDLLLLCPGSRARSRGRTALGKTGSRVQAGPVLLQEGDRGPADPDCHIRKGVRLCAPGNCLPVRPDHAEYRSTGG